MMISGINVDIMTIRRLSCSYDVLLQENDSMFCDNIHTLIKSLPPDNRYIFIVTIRRVDQIKSRTKSFANSNLDRKDRFRP